MNQWQNGQSDAAYSQQGLGHINPAMFSNLNSQAGFDLNGGLPFQQQQQAGLSNGFTGQNFQPGSVVPQKRQHDGSGMSGSPPPPNPSNQVSRSQTPNFAAGFNQQAGQQFGASATPNPYAHLQQPGSNHATPSPTMQNQPFRQPSRMSNASPSPFPQAQNNFNGGIQNAGQQNMGTPGQMPALNQQFAMNMPSMQQNNMQAGQNLTPQQQQHQQQQQRQYTMRLMQQQAALRAQQQQRLNGGQAVPNNTAGAVQNPGQSQPGMNGAAQANVIQAKRNQFLQQVAASAAKYGRQVNTNPQIGGRSVDLYTLFQLVAGANGSINVERNQQWQAIANKLGFTPAQYPTAADEIKDVFVNNLAPYERMWIAARTSQKQELARQHAAQMAGFSNGNQASPTKMQPPNQAQQFQQQFQQGPQATPQQHATPVQANAQIPQNGMSTPQQFMGAPGTLSHRRNSSMLKTMTPQQTPQGVAAQSPAPKMQQSPAIKPEPEQKVIRVEPPLSTEYEPEKQKVFKEFDGGVNLRALNGPCSTLHYAFTSVPDPSDMGIIDIRAITCSLASGIQSEVRYALDVLVKLSHHEQVALDISEMRSGDLLDVILDCAEEQAKALSIDEPVDHISLPSYEEVVRNAHHEATSLQVLHRLGTPEHELDRSADKVLAIMTILRNLSGFVPNFVPLVNSTALKWVSTVIKHIGTQATYLRTQMNVLDFYKDAVVFLANLTQELNLPSRDDALTIMHFLLAFGPEPVPKYTTSQGKLAFSPYVPKVHRYLPWAVDSLAKLLARQDPNRAYYRSIFSSTATPSGSEEPAIDLLTRAFALTLSTLPFGMRGAFGNTQVIRFVEARKPYLMQSMLAADILTTFLPNSESDVARAWLQSEDGWAGNLLSLASLLSVDHTPPPVPPGVKHPPLYPDNTTYRTISHRALSVLKRLAEKARLHSAAPANNAETLKQKSRADDSEVADEPEDPEPFAVKKYDGYPQSHAIIGAMLLPEIDKVSLRMLCGLHELALQT